MAARTIPTLPTWTAGMRVTGANLAAMVSFQNFWANPPMFRMLQSVTQSPANSTPTQITMDSSAWDSDSGRSGTAPFSYTIPAGLGGRWQFSWCVAWASNVTGSRVAVLYRNGSPALGNTNDLAANNDVLSEIATATIVVSAGDVMAVYGSQNSGGALSTVVNSQVTSFFEGRLVSLASP